MPETLRSRLGGPRHLLQPSPDRPLSDRLRDRDPGRGYGTPPPVLPRGRVGQTLGPGADSDDARPSIFNDDAEFALMTRHDEDLLRILYDPRLKVGMTRDEAMPLVRQIVEELWPGSSGHQRPPYGCEQRTPPGERSCFRRAVATSLNAPASRHACPERSRRVAIYTSVCDLIPVKRADRRRAPEMFSRWLSRDLHATPADRAAAEFAHFPKCDETKTSRLRRVDRPPALVVVLAPVIGFLIWVGLIALVL